MSVLRAGFASLGLFTFALMMGAIYGMVPGAQAQQTPPAPAASPAPSTQPLNVMVVDIRALHEKSKAASMVGEQLKQKRAEYEKEMRRQEQPLQQESETLQRQASSLSPDALNQKKKEFERKLADLDRSVQAKRQALQRADAEAVEKIDTATRDIIAEMAKEKKVDLVFPSTQLVMFSPAFDVTDAVLKKLDERLPTLTVNIVEQPAANAPAPQPASASAPAAPKKKK